MESFQGDRPPEDYRGRQRDALRGDRESNESGAIYDALINGAVPSRHPLQLPKDYNGAKQ